MLRAVATVIFGPADLARYGGEEFATIMPGMRTKRAGGGRLRDFSLSLSEHETFALLIYCVGGGGTGKPAVVYEGRAESCPGGFFMEVGARPPYWTQHVENYLGTTSLWKADEACDQAAIQSAYY